MTFEEELLNLHAPWRNPVEGEPPPSVAPPTEDGYYWLRFAECRYVTVPTLNDRPSRSHFSWTNPETYVELVRLQNGMTDWMGSDEGQPLETTSRRLIEVVRKLEIPA